MYWVISLTIKTELFDYQKKAIDKLQKIKVGALYMEQGTGKTRTALELIRIRHERKKIDHVIWLCPCSVKENLRRDIENHIGYVPDFITICGIETLSSSVKANIELNNLANDIDCYLIVDESNLIKNHKAKRTNNIQRLAEKCNYKLILNGTPVTRTEADLFSQWKILDWRILGYRSYCSFAANHIVYDEDNPNKIVRCLNIDYLTRKIAPYTYQIKKTECIDLPSKTYGIKYYQMDNEQSCHYADVANALLLEKDNLGDAAIYRLFTALQNVISGMYVDTSSKNISSKHMYDNPLDNPRMQILMDIIYSISDKAIIFCKYTHEIDSIVDIINSEYGDFTAVRFDGKLSLKKREESIDKFRNDSRFLVANKVCAGYGLNLQFCSYVIFYSNDFNYGTRAQAEDRVHRIGQTNNVHIIDICCENSLDEMILDCISRKEDMVDSFKDRINRMKDKDIKAMLGITHK